jgi:hypothetical protein
MTEIRAMTGEDLGAVTTLLDTHLPDWGGDRALLEATMLSHPWAEPELSSLVAVDEQGAVVGFIGAQSRRLVFDGRPLRGLCCSHLVVVPDNRGSAAGALLLGRLLGGPQDLTWSDSAIPIVARMWRTFGGELDHARACDWMLVLRPAGWVGSWAGSLAGRRRIDRDLIPVGSFPFSSLARLRPGGGEMIWEEGEIRRAGDPVDGLTGEDASAEQIVEAMPAIAARTRFRVDYDAEHLEHLFGQVRARAGELVCRLVRLNGKPVGWYAYLPRRATASRVLYLAGTERQIDLVLGELIEHARGRGSRVLAGRLEPHLDAPLRRRLAAIGLVRDSVVHAADPELRATLATGSALLTQLDGEWFLV